MKVNKCVRHASNCYFACEAEPWEPNECEFFVEGGKTRFHECKWEVFPATCKCKEAQEDSMVVEKIEEL